MSERDQRLDAAWRAASREEPPPALDAAIRAAARRAIVGLPRRGRNKHWWYPLAAAATVALLTVGIAQLTPSERVAPDVTDMAAAPGEARVDAALQAAAEKAPVTAAPASAPSPPESAAATSAAAVAAGAGAAERAPAPAARAQQKPVAEAKPQSVAQDKLARTAPERAAASSVPSPPAAPAPSARPLSEPFPATGAAESGRDAKLEEGSPAISTPARQAVEPMRAQSRVAAANVASADSAKLAPASARAVDDWIKRIRDLKVAGRLDEAAKELAAFRSAYGERADALLPEDLRQIRP
jgi:hypothetical protein